MTPVTRPPARVHGFTSLAEARILQLPPVGFRVRCDAVSEHTTRELLEALEALREQALHAAAPAAVERQRSKGKLLARERIAALLDPGSFVELDAFVQHRSPNFGMMENRPYGDGVVTGHGTVEGRRVFVFSQDFTVFGGSLGEAFAEKIVKVMDMAVKYGCPIVGINDSGGARSSGGSGVPGRLRGHLHP